MKKIFNLIIVGTLLATLGVAQPSRPDAAGGRRAWRLARPAGSHGAAGNSSLRVYVVTVGSPISTAEFGALDLRSGKFTPIGPGLPPDVGTGLVQGPGTSLLSLGFSGNLDAIDPRTGITTIVGPTGLGDCSTPVSPCGPNSANLIGRLDTIGGHGHAGIYVTDFANNLYSVNPTTGAAQLIGPTGIPPLYPTIPFSSNQDGTLNVYAESLFSAGGKLYATFSTATLNPETGAVKIVIPGALYQINPANGHTKLIAPTNPNLTSVVNVNDTVYGFDAAAGQVVILDVTTGHTTPVTDVDPAAGVIAGAAAVQPVPRIDD